MRDLERAAHEVLARNRVEGPGFAYTRPGGKYRWQWFWDSCLHAMVWRHFDSEIAKRELFSLFRFQEASGFVPHVSFHTPSLLGRLVWGRRWSSGLIQPPIAAEATWSVYEIDRDRQFLREIYRHLARFYRFLLTIRVPEGDRLFAYLHPWESGWDGAVRWDPVFGNRRAGRIAPWQMARPLRAVAWDQRALMARTALSAQTADGNTLLARNLRFLARIAAELDRRSAVAAWLAAAQSIEQAILHTLWDGDMFFDRLVIRGRRHEVRRHTPAAFFPLLLPYLFPEQKAALVSVLRKEFLAVPWPLPTVAPSDPAFDPAGYWRGTTWVNINYFVTLGLWEQQEYGLAGELLDRTLELVRHSGFWEYYNPLTGRGLGAREFSWSTLVVDLCRRATVLRSVPSIALDRRVDPHKLYTTAASFPYGPRWSRPH